MVDISEVQVYIRTKICFVNISFRKLLLSSVFIKHKSEFYVNGTVHPYNIV